MIRVCIESPFGSRLDGTRAPPEEVKRNLVYARRAMVESLRRGEAPFLSHLLYPQGLDDNSPVDRELGMRAGFMWQDVADRIVVYGDHGVTRGMEIGIDRAKRLGLWPEFRRIGP